VSGEKLEIPFFWAFSILRFAAAPVKLNTIEVNGPAGGTINQSKTAVPQDAASAQRRKGNL
jgi:hypothetical protein